MQHVSIELQVTVEKPDPAHRVHPDAVLQEVLQTDSETAEEQEESAPVEQALVIMK